MDNARQSEKTRLLQAMPIFGGMRADTLDFLLQVARYVKKPAGEYFYREGDYADSLFVLDNGKVQLLKRWNGNYYRLKDRVRGDCFGEVALIDLQPRNTSSLVIDDSCAIEIADSNLYQLYKREPEQFTLFRMNMAREVCRRLREADDRAFAADMQARRVGPLLVGGDKTG